MNHDRHHALPRAAQYFLALLTICVPGSAGTYSEVTYFSSVDGESLSGELWLPSGFVDDGSRRPLVVYLHGAGGDASVLRTHAGGAITAQLDARGWIGVAPDGRRWGLQRECNSEFSIGYVDRDDPDVGPGEQDILDLVDWAQANFDIDPQRVYLMGFSFGGRGAYVIALKNPDRFAAVAPLAPVVDAHFAYLHTVETGCSDAILGGVPGTSDRVNTLYKATSARFLIENAYNLPVFHAHGQADGIATNRQSQDPFLNGWHLTSDSAFDGCLPGSTTLCFGSKPTLSELHSRHPDGYDWARMFTSGGHWVDASWINGGLPGGKPVGVDNPDAPGQLLGVMDFFAARTRVSSPDTVVFKTYDDEHRSAYWLELGSAVAWTGSPAAIRATRDVAANRITVELARVSNVDFDLLAAGLALDVDHPLEIIVSPLAEAAFDPDLAVDGESYETMLTVRGAAVQNLAVTRNGAALAVEDVVAGADFVEVGPVLVAAGTTLRLTSSAPPLPAPDPSDDGSSDGGGSTTGNAGGDSTTSDGGSSSGDGGSVVAGASVSNDAGSADGSSPNNADDSGGAGGDFSLQPGDDAEDPDIRGGVAGGLCGAGMVSSLAATFASLAAARRRRREIRRPPQPSENARLY